MLCSFIYSVRSSARKHQANVPTTDSSERDNHQHPRKDENGMEDANINLPHQRRELRVELNSTSVNGSQRQLTDDDNVRRLSFDGHRQAEEQLLVAEDQLEVDNVAILTRSSNLKDGAEKGDMTETETTQREKVVVADSAISVRSILVLLVFGVCAVIYGGK